MDEFLKIAMSIVQGQASVRPMTADEIALMVADLAKKLAGLSCGCGVEAPQEAAISAVDAKKSIKEKSVTCLECGKTFKILSGKHLASHGLDKKTYCEKFGFKRGTSLAAKELVRARKKRMSEMKLWERRGKGKKAAEAKPAAAPKKAAKKATPAEKID